MRDILSAITDYPWAFVGLTVAVFMIVGLILVTVDKFAPPRGPRGIR